MSFSTKLALGTLSALTILILLPRSIRSLSNLPLAGERGLLIQQNINEDAGLKEIVDRNLDSQQGEYAVVIKSLRPGPSYEYYLNPDKIFPSASLYKLFLLAGALEKIEKGALKEDEVITADTKHLEEVLGFEDFGYAGTGEKISYSVSEVLDRIATISDNYASIMLAENIGWGEVQRQADKVGTKSTSIADPITTSAYDIALFFEKLYQGGVVSTSSSQTITDLLSKSQINNRIPAKLPQGLKIAHKTAELPRLRHDAGIVFLDEKPYVIVLMSNGLQYEDDGIEVLANISKDVFEYLNGRE